VPGHIGLDGFGVPLMHKDGFAQRTLALAAFVLKQMAFALTAAEDLTGAGDLEPLCNGLSGFSEACVLGHKGPGEYGASPSMQEIFRAESQF
jgi:hypothetical protein